MKRFWREVRSVGGAWVLAVALGGCATPNDANAPIGMKYTGGRLTAVEAASFEQVWRASYAALNACDVTVMDQEKTMVGGTVDGLTPDLKAVRVTVHRLSETKTELRIRIDTFGNEELTKIIYEKFKIALGPAS